MKVAKIKKPIYCVHYVSQTCAAVIPFFSLFLV